VQQPLLLRRTLVRSECIAVFTEAENIVCIKRNALNKGGDNFLKVIAPFAKILTYLF
jgi:hypothetical protein